MTEQIKFILMMVYKPTNILHVLDLIKFTTKASEVLHHTFEYCGYKDSMHDLTVFCSLDGLDDSFLAIEFLQEWLSRLDSYLNRGFASKHFGQI